MLLLHRTIPWPLAWWTLWPRRASPLLARHAAAARIEASKVFSKDLMKKYDIPTADYETFDDPAKVMDYIRSQRQVPGRHQGGRPGAGQGRADLPRTRQGAADGVKEIMLDKKFGRFRQPCCGGRIFDRAGGHACCSFADGKTVEADGVHTWTISALLDGRRGPEHRRHGHRRPQPLLHRRQLPTGAWRRSSCPRLRPCKQEGCPFKGCLYFGLMLTPDGPKVH